MAHTDLIVKKRTGQEAERLFLSICAGMLQSARAYQIEKDNNPTEAINQIKRAVDMPHRVGKRLQAFADTYGQAYLEECLSLAGAPLTYAEILTQIVSMKEYSDSLVLDYQTNNNWDEIAGLILLQVENEALKYIVPIPDNYVDIWG